MLRVFAVHELAHRRVGSWASQLSGVVQMSVVVFLCSDSEGRRANFLRWLALLGHHGLDARTAEEARLTLGCVQATLVVIDASSASVGKGGPSDWCADGMGLATREEKEALELLGSCTSADGSRPTVFVIGARARAYRLFRKKLAVGDRFLDVPIESDAAGQAIADLLAEPERLSTMWPSSTPAAQMN